MTIAHRYLFIYQIFLVNKLNKLQNLFLFIILRLELNYLTFESQQELLEPLNLMPFKFRFFYRFSLFSHKVLNKNFLLNISNLLKNLMYLSNSGAKCISIILSIMISRNSTNLALKDFSGYILSKLHSLFLKFSQFILKRCKIVPEDYQNSYGC